VNDYYEDETRFGNSSFIFLGIESDDVYSQKTLSFIHLLQTKILALNDSLPGQNVAALLGLTPEEGAKLVEGIKGLGINEMNYPQEMTPVVTSASALKDKLGLDDALARKVSDAAARVDPAALYHRYEEPIHKLEDLINADSIVDRDDSLVVENLVDEKAITTAADGSSTFDPQAVAALKAKIKSWDIYQGALVNGEGKFGSLIVRLNSNDMDVKISMNNNIARILAETKADGIETYLDGEPVIEDQISRSMLADTMVLLPLVVLVVLLILFFCFRNFQGVLYPSLAVLMSVIWAEGFGAWMGIPVSVVGIVTPVLLVAIASAYGIHHMNHYFLDPDQDKVAILDRNTKTVGLAILLSAITVMVGFGALAVEDFVPIRNFGILTAFGDLVAVIAALLVLPAMILAGKKPKTEYHETKKGFVTWLLHLFVRINRRHSKLVLVVSSVLVVVFAIGTFWVKVELNNVSFFKTDAPVRIADDRLNEKLAGTEVMNVVLDTDLSDILGRSGDPADPVVLTTPTVLNKVEAFNQAVRKQFPYVTKVLSFNTMLKKMNQEMSGGGPEAYSIPQDPNLISQYLLIFSGDLQSVLSSSHDKMRISVTMKRVSTDESEAVAKFALQYFGRDFLKANHLQANVTGTAHLYYVANVLLVDGTIKSIVICVVVVFLLLLYVLKGFWISLISMVPIFITLVIDFGMLGLFNIPLNTATAMVSSLAIGIGVDYSIHYITWYRSEIRKKRDITLALENTILHKGRAILYNMLVIFGGFLVLVVSKFVPLIQFGLLVAICMVTTAVGALVFVPAAMKLLAKRERKFLYMEEKTPARMR
jgi:predicted RND superfamily exporter protein